MSVTDQRTEARPYNSQAASGIRLAPQFVNRLCSRLETAHSMPDGVSGLLFGTSHDGILVVQAFRSLIDSDIAEIEAGRLPLDDAVQGLARAAETDPSLTAVDAVGWYAFRPLGGLHEADIEFHDRQFPASSDVALIVRRADGGFLLFEFYARDQEGRLTERQHRWGASRFSPAQSVAGPVEIAFRARAERFTTEEPSPQFRPQPAREDPEARWQSQFSILGSSEDRQSAAEKASGRRRLITTGELASVPAVIAPPKRSSSVPWVSSAILFALAAGATFAFLLLKGVPSSSSVSFWQALLPDTGLNLRAEGQGDRVLLSWNRRNSVVRSAAGAVLHIDDGTQHRDVSLTAAQAANGAVLYRPNSDDVSFRLQVRGQDGRGTADSLRILDSRGPSAQAVDLTGSNTSASNTGPATIPIETAHVWQPVPGRSRVTVPEPIVPLETPKPARDKFDLSRLTTPAIPNAGTTAPTIPATTQPGSPTPTSNSPAIRSEPGSTEPGGQTQPRFSPEQQREPEQFPAQPVSNQQTPAQNQFADQTQAPANQLPVNRPAPAQPTTAQNAVPNRYTPPRPIRQVLPDIASLPPSVIASTPEINVIVTVDKSGRVTHAKVEQHGRKAAHAMIVAAEDAARQWLFEPARLDDRTITSEHSIVFQFGGR